MRKRFPDESPPAPKNGLVPRRSQRVTIKDVAAAAGVSPATVSKYFAERAYYVSAATRSKIEAAVTALDYQPNAAARALARRRSQIIGVIVPSVANPYYPELLGGIEQVVGASGYSLTLATTDRSPEREAAMLSLMRQQQVAGLILATVPPTEVLHQLRDGGTQIVMVSRSDEENGLPGVQIDNHVGAELATRHLAGHGHSRIAMITGPQHASSFRQRVAGYRQACEELGLPSFDLMVESRYPSMADGYEACAQLLEGRSPTAVFVANDLMAMGVLGYCHEHGVRVPEDLAVVGFDNIWVSGLPHVGLSTIDGATREVGRLAATRLIARLRPGADADDDEFTMLAPKMVERASCGPH